MKSEHAVKPALPLKKRSHFARRLAELRETKGLSLKAVADAVGTTAWAIQWIEDGRGEPKLSTAQRIAVSLGVPFTDLLGPSPTDVPLAVPGRPVGRQPS